MGYLRTFGKVGSAPGGIGTSGHESAMTMFSLMLVNRTRLDSLSHEESGNESPFYSSCKGVILYH